MGFRDRLGNGDEDRGSVRIRKIGPFPAPNTPPPPHVAGKKVMNIPIPIAAQPAVTGETVTGWSYTCLRASSSLWVEGGEGKRGISSRGKKRARWEQFLPLPSISSPPFSQRRGREGGREGGRNRDIRPTQLLFVRELPPIYLPPTSSIRVRFYRP